MEYLSGHTFKTHHIRTPTTLACHISSFYICTVVTKEGNDKPTLLPTPIRLVTKPS